LHTILSKTGQITFSFSSLVLCDKNSDSGLPFFLQTGQNRRELYFAYFVNNIDHNHKNIIFMKFTMDQCSRVVADYIFIDGAGNFRTKNRVQIITNNVLVFDDFSTDGSSTGQASESGNTEIILRPVFFTNNPLRPAIVSYIVLCETYDAVTNEPLPSNTRARAKEIFEKADVKDLEIWFGPEQEYYLKQVGEHRRFLQVGPHYCGIEVNPTQQFIVEKHMEACLVANLNFYGTNAEVASNQWEFQLGPCLGILAADELMLARFLLEKIAAQYQYQVCYDPKPYEERSGSGCHINFSTKETRSEGGFDALMEKFAATHREHIDVYGKGNERRLTGECETAPIDKFSYGIGTRNTSMRISNKCKRDGFGYIEDRRPAANVDPYLAMTRIAETLLYK
jgi:glutamine synthetase